MTRLKSKFYHVSGLFHIGPNLLRRIKKTDASKLQDEYAKLVEGLQEAASDEDTFMANPGKFYEVMNHCFLITCL